MISLWVDDVFLGTWIWLSGGDTDFLGVLVMGVGELLICSGEMVLPPDLPLSVACGT